MVEAWRVRMKRFMLCVPVLLIGLPLLGCLILAHSRPATPAAVEGAAAVADTKEESATKAAAKKKGELPDNDGMVKLAKTEPMAFIENCLVKYTRQVKTGYTLTLWKHEVIDGVEYKPETIEVAFRQDPYSVYFHWEDGARKAERVLYVEGENKDRNGKSQMVIQPNGAFLRRFIVTRDVEGPEAKQSGHYPLSSFGFQKNEERTLSAWRRNFATGHEKVEFIGIQKVKELDNRSCFVLRSSTDTPDDDQVCELTSFWDCETWFQTGSIIKDKDGKLLGEYYFKDVKLDPEFKPEQFTRDMMK
jgi:hypothetical protein